MQVEKINISGAIKNLKVGDNPLILERDLYDPITVRNTARRIREQHRRRFEVNVTDKFIKVTRRE